MAKMTPAEEAFGELLMRHTAGCLECMMKLQAAALAGKTDLGPLNETTEETACKEAVELCRGFARTQAN